MAILLRSIQNAIDELVRELLQVFVASWLLKKSKASGIKTHLATVKPEKHKRSQTYSIPAHRVLQPLQGLNPSCHGQRVSTQGACLVHGACWGHHLHDVLPGKTSTNPATKLVKHMKASKSYDLMKCKLSACELHQQSVTLISHL